MNKIYQGVILDHVTLGYDCEHIVCPASLQTRDNLEFNQSRDDTREGYDIRGPEDDTSKRCKTIEPRQTGDK